MSRGPNLPPDDVLTLGSYLRLFLATRQSRLKEPLLADHDSILAQLMAVIEQRKVNPPARSYTSQLFEKGLPKIGAKVLEEAREVVEAATEDGPDGREHLIYEAGDLVYHLLVLLAERDVTLAEVESELGRRFGVSGLDEKESRSQ